MTAQELAAEMHKFGIITFNRWAIDGAAMLLQQAEQIEALTKERDDAYVQSLQLSAENKALKADAERYKWLKQRLLCADFSYGDPSEACNALVFEIPEDMRVSADLDSSIDAMKGAT